MEYGEDPLECGARELIEETGYKAEEFTHLGEYYEHRDIVKKNLIFFSQENLPLSDKILMTANF